MDGPKLTINSPKPFLKWAGGKRSLLGQIVPLLRITKGAYFEPFLGAGAVFLSLEASIPKSGSDVNEDLIITWRAIRDNPESVIGELELLDNSKETFLRVRSLDRVENWIENTDPIIRAARTIFLNRTCFNGLFRVNSSGHFNVPYGKHKNPRIVDRENLMAVSSFLRQRDANGFQPVVETRDYFDAVSGARAGDVVYFDPPYVASSATARFVNYASGGFNEAEQSRLRDLAIDLLKSGVRTLTSNSDTDFVRSLYGDKKFFELISTQASRSIGANSSTRGLAPELLILGKPSGS